MSDPLDQYWRVRLADTAKALEKNRFTARVVENVAEAKAVLEKELLPADKPATVSFGGSMTAADAGLFDVLRSWPGAEVIETMAPDLPADVKFENRRKALLADFLLTGSNAVTETGKLVNLDMIGNRVGALACGPKRVVVVAGRNKIVPDVPEAKARIKELCAPVNAMRLNLKTPCAKTGRCQECASPDRICNVWVINEKSFPAGRIHVILVNEDLGY